MHISRFNIGDIIVRTRPSLPIHNGHGDRSYMGYKIMYQGSANGMIYGRRLNSRNW